MRLRQRFSTVAYLCLLALLGSSVTATAQVNIYQRGYNNSRTNANLQETILTPANVNPTNFGKLFTIKTDGQIYASPLYVSNLAINGGTHNVLYVATMFNTMYALDADTGTVLWQQNYGYPIIAEDVQNNQNIDWRTGIGILSTPVIDPSTDIMYFVNANQPQNGAQQFSFKLNALDIRTGEPVHGSPVTISATYSNSDTTKPVVFNAKMQNQRPGLTIANGNVYLGFGSRQDQTPYYGWVMAYSESTLAQTAVYVDTPMDGWGGIWNAGQAPVVDSAGNLYFTTGNGAAGSTPNNNVQAGSSFVKLSPTLQLLDYFTPSNASTLNSGDMDLGSAGIMLVPNTNYLLGGGKQGVFYLVNTANMGHFNASGDQVQQEFQAVFGKGTSHIHGTPVYFNSDKNGPTTYVWGENDVLRGFTFNQTTGKLNTTPFAMSTMTAPVTNNDGAMPGGFLSISANGNSNGILWASTPLNADAVVTTVQGVLYAFNADTLQPLWSDKNNDARDEVGYFAKYVPPTVANGKVYVPTFGALGTNDGSGALVVYGLLNAPPTLTVNVANETMPAGSTLPTFTGTVNGLKNGDTLGNQIIVTYSTTATSNSPAGTYPITATVTGSDAKNYQVVVDAGTLTITQPTQTLTVTANNATRAYGAANPTFTGTITGAQNGNTFTESFSTTATATSNVGNYPIVPAASGNNLNNYNVVIVDGTLDVTAAATTTTLSAPGTSTYGSSITLVATVTSSAGIPAGTVTFYSGSNAVGTATLNGSGVAMLNTAALAVGTDAITASYAAAGNFAASTSTAGSVTVSQASQTITFPAISSRPYGSSPFAVTATSSAGSSYPVTITVQSGPAAISGGVVSLTGAGTVVLQATQAGNTNYSSATTTQSFQVTPAPLTVSANNASRAYGAANPTFSGTVTGAVGSDSFNESFTTAAATTSNVGSYPIVPAVTGPQSNYTITYVNGSLSVTGATTTTTVGAPGTASYGANVALTATVSSTAGTPGGIVTFYSGSTNLGTGTLNGSGVATLSTTTLPVGTDAVSATYAATGNFAASTSTATNITVSTASQTITFPAVPSRAYGSAPFAVSATSSLGSSYPVVVTVSSGPAVINGGLVTITGAGTVVLQASQAGDSNYGAATTSQSFQVVPAQLTVTAGSATRAYGAANPAFSGTITGAVGSDTFTESFTTAATSNSNAGSYPIVPAAAGAALGNYTVTVVNGTLTVSPLATSITLSAAGSASYGASVTLTATVSSTSGTPGGLVTFLSGSTPLGTIAVNAGGTAVLSTSALAAGTDAVTASYPAQGNYAASTAAASITINEASQTINFPAIASRPYGSAPFAVSATSSLGSSYPVTITVASGPATISGGMVSIAGVGTVVLKASQAGNNSYGPASATQSFQVTPAATATALTAPQTAEYGVGVTLTATVTSTAGTPGGTVTFYNGSASLGTGTLTSSGAATLNTTALPEKTDSITAVYAATGDFAASTSAAVTVTVSAPPPATPASYSMNASPSSLTVKQGAAGNTMLTFTPAGGYSGAVALSCSNVPANVSCVFAQNQVTLTGNNQSVNVGLTLQTTLPKTAVQQASAGAHLPTGLLALAFYWPGSLTGIAVFVRKRKLGKMKVSWQICLLLLCTLAFGAGLSGCGVSGFVANPTPGNVQVTVVATGTTATAVPQTLVLNLNITQ
jgi:Bacterial Ig-like domain (group 3)/MBG domain (YGX type)/PQQ enzyme repeat